MTLPGKVPVPFPSLARMSLVHSASSVIKSRRYLNVFTCSVFDKDITFVFARCYNFPFVHFILVEMTPKLLTDHQQ